MRCASRRRLAIASALAANVLLVACWEPEPEVEPAVKGKTVLDVPALEQSLEALLERSRQIRDGARADYQAEALAATPRTPKNGPFFRLDDRLPAAVVTEAAPRAVADDDGMLFGFEFVDGEPSGFRSANGEVELRVRDGHLRLENQTDDHLISTAPLAILPEEVGEIAIRMRSERGDRLHLSWMTDGPGHIPWKRKLDINLVSDGTFRTYVIDAKAAITADLQDGEHITNLLLRPTDSDGARVEIDFVRFISRYSKYSQAPRGTEYENLGGVWRRVLYMLPTQAVEYRLEIPRASPIFDFGIGVLFEDAPVAFEVVVADGDDETRLFEEVVHDPAAWRDVRLDLAAWAGREVRLQLRVAADSPNVAFWSSPLLASEPPMPMNVIVLLEDTLRADRLSTQGYAVETSPNKTRFMEEDGVLFLNAISQATKTRPSIPTLMTSLVPTATGVWNFADTLDDAYLTMAEILRSQGFVTTAFIQNGNAGPQAGLHQGYDQLVDRRTLGREAEEVLGEKVFGWIDRNRHRNFFLYLHTLDPHGAYDPPPPFDGAYHEAGPGVTPVKRDQQFDPDWIEEPMAEGRSLLYDGEIRHNDSLLPRLLRTLKKFGLRENTLVILTSDHGEFLGEHGLWGHRPPGQRQVIHVPLMLAYPARFPGGVRIPQNVQLIDVLPTVLELAQIDRSRLLMMGESLVDLIEGRRLPYWNDRATLSEEPLTFTRGKATASGSFLFRDWHLISSRTYGLRPPAKEPARARENRSILRVFNFREDPGETRAIDEGAPALTAAYWTAMRELQANNLAASQKWTARRGEATLRYDPEEVERLRKLGYMR